VNHVNLQCDGSPLFPFAVLTPKAQFAFPKLI
jgi:hypothetical protein